MQKMDLDECQAWKHFTQCASRSSDGLGQVPCDHQLIEIVKVDGTAQDVSHEMRVSTSTMSGLNANVDEPGQHVGLALE
jgi:hypothetical protein